MSFQIDVSGLPSSKVSACSTIIKDIAEARPGGNRAIFIKTKSNTLSPDQKRPRSDNTKSLDKAMPKCLSSTASKPQPLLLQGFSPCHPPVSSLRVFF